MKPDTAAGEPEEPEYQVPPMHDVVVSGQGLSRPWDLGPELGSHGAGSPD